METRKCVEHVFFLDKAKPASLLQRLKSISRKQAVSRKMRKTFFNAFPFPWLHYAHKNDGNDVTVMTFNHTRKIEGDAATIETIEEIH